MIDTFSEVFELEASPVEGQSLLKQKDTVRKGEKGKAQKNKKNEKPKDIALGVNGLNINLTLVGIIPT